MNLSILASSSLVQSTWLGRSTISADERVFVGGWSSAFLTAFHTDTTKDWDFPATSVLCTALGRDGTVYAPSYTGSLFAVRADGSQAWTFDLNSNNAIGCPVVGGDGTIYVGADEMLFAVDPDGQEAWSTDTGGWIRFGPSLGPDGTVYVGSDSDSLYAVDPTNGHVDWTFPTGGDISSAPVVGTDGTIYVGSADHQLYAVDPDGQEDWHFLTGWDVDTIALGADGTVFLSSWDTRVYALDASGGMVWSTPTCGVPRGGMVVGADGTVYVVAMNSCNRLYALDASDGSVIDTVEGVGFLGGIGADGRIYAVSGSAASQSETMIVIGE